MKSILYTCLHIFIKLLQLFPFKNLEFSMEFHSITELKQLSSEIMLKTLFTSEGSGVCLC